MLLFVLPAVLVVALLVGGLVIRRRRVATLPPLPAVEKPRRRELVLTEAVPAPATISGDVSPPPRPRPLVLLPPVLSRSEAKAPEDLAFDALDALLEDLESTTVRIDGADTLDEHSVAELEELAGRLEAAAASFAGR